MAPPGALATADPDVEVLRVLADHDEVDLGRSLVRQRRLHAGQELDRPEVDVLVEVEPEREQDPLLEDAGLDALVADRTEVDRPELREFREVVLGQELAGLEVAVRADRELGEVEVEAVALAGRFEDAAALATISGPIPSPPITATLCCTSPPPRPPSRTRPGRPRPRSAGGSREPGRARRPAPPTEIVFAPRSTETSAPSSNAAVEGVVSGRRPTLIAFRKKMRANDSATTYRTPAPFSASGACSRDEPQPKFRPPTITSPGSTDCANSSRVPSNACFASSAGSLIIRNRPGMIASVSISSPNFQTRGAPRSPGASRSSLVALSLDLLGHRHTSRGSVISPVIAVAAAVAADAR